jgi:anthranilate synthase component II
MKILVFDNYDSFTYNLVHLIEKITGEEPSVFRNDKIKLEDIDKYDKILLSPGPGLPMESGILIDVIRTYSPSKSIFGVCLGLQAMAEAFGGKLQNLSSVYHGVATPVMVTAKEEPVFKGVPQKFDAGRYHSWVAEKASLPDCFQITAEDENGLIMGMRHKTYDLSAVQFHPESILTSFGEDMLRNWLEYNKLTL